MNYYLYLRTYLCLALLFFNSIASNGQPNHDDFLQFKITNKKDTIDFIKINKDINTAKPTLLFCQGSLPIPVIVRESGGYFIAPLSNIDYGKYSADYNIILIAPPHTPLIAPDSLLSNYNYVPNLNEPDKLDQNYLDDNYLERYVERANIVLKFLRKQSWVDKSKIILLGHSQGAHVAARIAASNNDILAIGYFSGNVLGRFSQFILREMHKEFSGKKSQEEVQKSLVRLNETWRDMCRGNTQGWGDSGKTWLSFSNSNLEMLAKVKTPIYIAYGTKDIGPNYCELLPVFFELNKKINYVTRPFLNCGHNFEVINEDGSSDYNRMAWDTAFSEFINWCSSLSYTP